MANYNVDIAVALKGAKELLKLRKDINAVTQEVSGFNKALQTNANKFPKTINNLTESVNKARTALRNAAVGTTSFNNAAQVLLKTQKELNKELAEEARILKQIETRRFGVAQSSSGNRVRRNVAESRRSRISSKFKTLDTATPSIDLRNRVRENLLQSRIGRFSSGFADFSQTVDSSIAAQNQRAIKTNVLRNIRESQRSRIGGGFRSLSLSGQTSPVGEKIARALENEKKLVKEVEAIRGRASKKRAANTKRQLSLEKRSNAFVKKAIKEETALRKKAEAEANKLAEKRRARRQKLGSTASSAIIGGAFPLLFGQTGAAAVGGGLGGAAGGLIGGQFGFALSILGTAIGSAIDKNDKFNQSLAALNVRFSDVSGSAQLTAEDIDKVAKRLRITKEEAFGVLGAFSQFGSGSIAKSLTQIFGTDSGAFDTLAATNRQAQLANQIFEARTKIGNQVATQLLQQNLINDSASVELALALARAKAANDIDVAQKKQITNLDRLRDAFGGEFERSLAGGKGAERFGEARGNKAQKEFEEGRTQRMKDFKIALEEVRNMIGLVDEANGQFGQSGVLAFSAINDKVKDLQDEMKKLANPIYTVLTLSETMATSFENSFKGIIKGTMSVSDAFRNMLNRIADHFLDTAARMMANQLSQMILGSVFNAFTSSGTRAVMDDFGMSRADASTIASGGFVETVFEPKAAGGPVKRGGSYLVGERGPELFSPASSGMITPNHALGGGTTVVVNVDASGSNVEGDEEEGRQLGIVLSAAIESELIKQKRPGGLLA